MPTPSLSLAQLNRDTTCGKDEVIEYQPDERIVNELVDPRDNLPFYVGQIYKHPARRLKEHLNDAGDYFAAIADSESPKDERIIEIILAGL